MPQTSHIPELNISHEGDERWALLLRIAGGSSFKASARLREFLFYIGDCAIRNAPEQATEQQIGFHVFRRNPGYNSSEDSIVRSHARLLRQKLAEHFAEDGRDEQMIVEVPKGHYLPVFHSRDSLETVADKNPAHQLAVALPTATDNVAQPLAVNPPAAYPWKSWILCLLLVLLGAALFFLGNRWLHRPAALTSVDRFWKPFFKDDPPLIVFSNALFVGDSKSGLSYAPQGADAGRPNDANLVDTYTGIGELSAVYTLTRLFDAHQSHFILKRSRLMTWDEAKVKNLIFIGSTAENPSLSALQSTRDFGIVASADSAGIVNHHPRPGEPAVYSRPEHPLSLDYAIVALLPGMQAGERILIFSGLTTYGTQAAVEFLCRPETADELLRQVSSPKGEIRPFEAVIETTITGGVPVQAKLMTVHVK